MTYKTLNKTDMENLALGAAFLGSGGGGNPHYELDMIEFINQQYKPAKVIQISGLADDALILPVAFMGAPMVGLEKIPSGLEFENILKAFKDLHGKYPDAIIPAEIGGANGLTPFLFAGIFDIPILDADLLGRAYPKLEMASANLFGITASPTFLADSLGNHYTLNCLSAEKIEAIARVITVQSGSSIGVGMYSLTAEQAKEALILGSISKAIELGKVISSQQNLECLGVTTHAKGIISNIDYKVQDGFLVGTVQITDELGNIFIIQYQNEYLFLSSNEKIIATTPDIICILDQDTLKPISSESISFGLRVYIASMRGPEIWYSEKGLKLVGPEVFNLK